MIPIRLARAAFALFVLAATPSQAHAAGAGPAVPVAMSARLEALSQVAEAEGTVPVIVQFEPFGPPFPTLPPAAQQARLLDIRDKGARLLADLQGWGRIENVKKFDYTPQLALHVDTRTLDVLAHHPLVVDIVQDRLKAPTLAQTIPLMQVDANAWAGGWTGSGQTVAILDSGVDKTHPFLASKVVSEACYSTTRSGGGLWQSSSLCPDGLQASVASGSGVNCSGISGCDHGTHVAGIAAGKDPGNAQSTGFSGVAPDASLVAIQVFSRFDSAYYCGGGGVCILSWDSDQLAALQRVLALSLSGYPIASVNMSLGGGRYYSSCDDDPLKPIIDDLRAAGIAVAIASGNNGYKDSISAPACISSAISVGSTCDGGGSYCSGGTDSVASYSNIASFVSLLAPGSAVTSSVPGGSYATWHGTSMATPHVAGAWAVRKQQNPIASVDEVLGYFKNNGFLVNDTRSGGSVSGMSRLRFAPSGSGGEPPPQPVQQFVLTVRKDGSGRVTGVNGALDCGSTCSVSLDSGAVATLQALPDDGHAFTGWSAPCSGDGDCVVTVNGDTEVTATFSPLPTASTAPQAPSNLRAKALPKQRIQVSWTDNSGDETRFELQRSGSDGSTAAIVLDANTTQTIDGPLKRGVSYTYELAACNDAGCSASVSASATAK